MTYVLNPHLKVTPRLGENGLEWAVDAAVRGEGLRQSVVTQARMPGAHAFLLQVAASLDDSLRVDADTAADLAAIGFLVPRGSKSDEVQFSATLDEPLYEDVPLPRTLVVNRHVRFDDAPLAVPFARGSVVYVVDPVRHLELPYWIDGDETSLITRLLDPKARPPRLSKQQRAALAGAGILHDPEQTRAQRGRLARMFAKSRAQIDAPGFAALGELLPPLFLAAMRRYFRTKIAEGHLKFGDAQSPGRYNMHNEPFCVWLHEQITALIARAIPRPIKKSYTYAAAYKAGAELEIHTDRPQCEYTLSLTLDATPDSSREAAWPLCLASAADDAVVQVLLVPGDALLFRGRKLPHFRERLDAGRTSTSLLFHFVNRSFRGRLS